MPPRLKIIAVWSLGLAVLLIPAGYAHSETKKSCEKKGYVLCPGTKTCGSKTCIGPGGGGVRPYKPGETYCTPDGKCIMCDGCTGSMVEPERSEEGGGKRPPKLRPEDIPPPSPGQTPPGPAMQ